MYERDIEKLRALVFKYGNMDCTPDDITEMINLIREIDLNAYFRWNVFTGEGNLVLGAISIILKHDIKKELLREIQKERDMFREQVQAYVDDNLGDVYCDMEDLEKRIERLESKILKKVEKEADKNGNCN